MSDAPMTNAGSRRINHRRAPRPRCRLRTARVDDMERVTGIEPA
ncbi:MAG: hypothetical protein ACO3IV_01515 [Ilumatobacteraceae bacterium]